LIREKPVERLGKRVLFGTRRFEVVEASMRIRGKEVTKPYIRQNDCAEVLAVTETGSAVLIRSYRPEIDGYCYELPSGTLKDGEDPKAGAARELLEETGFRAKSIRRMFSGYPLFGYSDCELHFFLATGIEKGEQRLEDDESIQVREFPLAEVPRLVKAGKIKDLNVLTAVCHLRAAGSWAQFLSHKEPKAKR
jgi:ADP-ribose pyrophosphatase